MDGQMKNWINKWLKLVQNMNMNMNQLNVNVVSAELDWLSFSLTTGCRRRRCCQYLAADSGQSEMECLPKKEGAESPGIKWPSYEAHRLFSSPLWTNLSLCLTTDWGHTKVDTRRRKKKRFDSDLSFSSMALSDVPVVELRTGTS